MIAVRTPALRAIVALCAGIALAGCGSMKSMTGGWGSTTSAVGYVADLRLANGLSPLASDPQLEKAALEQARYMARAARMEHTTGWGKDFASRVAENDIKGPAAENIARGRFDTAKVISVWKDSPPHRKNMLDPRMNRFGLAYVRDAKNKDVRYWAMVLAK
jgi:uncharacterized protein YkwD